LSSFASYKLASRISGAGDASNDDFASRHHVEQWWNKLLTEEDKTRLELSGKLVLLFDILTLAQQLGDKVSVLTVFVVG